MPEHTPIQWPHSTVNPVAGCDGCPLYTPSAKVRSAITVALVEVGVPRTTASRIVENVTREMRTSDLYHLREQVADQIHGNCVLTGVRLKLKTKALIARTISAEVRCYAATLTMRWGENPRRPGKKLNKGLPRRFEEVTFFPGRMRDAAAWPNLHGHNDPAKPWLNGCRRLIFVSDMGDALSKAVSFDYLLREIIEVVTSPAGRRHIWLWLTKRPRRMAEFAEWLAKRGIPWPPNLVPMTSVIDQRMADQIHHLRRIPAKIRGLSVEPLWEDVDLDLDGFNWIIAGGESGPYAKPFDLAWARKLRDQCRAEGKAFFMKQLGARPILNGKQLDLIDGHGGDWDEWPVDLRIREVPPEFRNTVL